MRKLLINFNFFFNRSSHGFLHYYDKNYDLIRTKTEKPLVSNDKIRFFVTTSKDPIIEQVNK